MRLTGKVPPPQQAVAAVLSILKKSPNGASTREIYERAAPKTIPRNEIESAEEPPFQSMRFLKKTVLAAMQRNGTIEKYHVMKDPSPEQVVETAKLAARKTVRKPNPVAPRRTWLWRIHEWGQSIEQARESYGKRLEAQQHKQQSTKSKEHSA